MKRNINSAVIAMSLCTLILSACTPPAPTPADVPSATVAPTETSLQLPTLPPSWTPGAAATVTPFSEGSSGGSEVTATELPVTVEGAATLPPTWTPFRIPTVTPQPRAANATFTPVPPTSSPAVSPTRSMDEGPLPVQPSEIYANPECKKMTIFSELYQYKQPKTDVMVGWVNVIADYYDLWVRNPEGRYTYREFVPIPEGEQVAYFNIPGSVFSGIGQYTWEVYPVQNEYRMCPTISGTIFIGQRF